MAIATSPAILITLRVSCRSCEFSASVLMQQRSETLGTRAESSDEFLTRLYTDLIIYIENFFILIGQEKFNFQEIRTVPKKYSANFFRCFPFLITSGRNAS